MRTTMDKAGHCLLFTANQSSLSTSDRARSFKQPGSSVVNDLESTVTTEQYNYYYYPDGYEELNDYSDDYDEETLASLRVRFHPWFASTSGMSRPSSPDILHQERYYHVLNNCVKEEMINQVSEASLQNIKKLTKRSDLLEKYKKSREAFLDQTQHYVWAIKKSIVDYILKEDKEQERLGVTLVRKVCYWSLGKVSAVI